MKKKIYIIGKVTGLEPEMVKRKFDVYASRLRDSGFIPINPIEIVNDMNADWHDAMRLCIPELMKADGVHVQLDADNDSRGSSVEMSLCKALDIPMFENIESLVLYFQRNCTHPKSAVTTKIVNSIVNCETTVTICNQCGKQLSAPVTDCA